MGGFRSRYGRFDGGLDAIRIVSAVSAAGTGASHGTALQLLQRDRD